MLNHIPSFETNLCSNLLCSLAILCLHLTFSAKELDAFPSIPLQ